VEQQQPQKSARASHTAAVASENFHLKNSLNNFGTLLKFMTFLSVARRGFIRRIRGRTSVKTSVTKSERPSALTSERTLASTPKHSTSCRSPPFTAHRFGAYDSDTHANSPLKKTRKKTCLPGLAPAQGGIFRREGAS
jgi:hypothetical protein